MNSTASKICCVPDCGLKHHAKGYCSKHAAFVARRGDVNAPRLLAPWGTGSVTEHGYRTHTLKSVSGYRPKYEHIQVAEKALGRLLPKGAQVHHVNEDKLDNRPSNLVICPDNAYHQLLHRRTRAYDACGHADWLKCGYCGKYDDPSNLTYIDRGPRHLACAKEYAKNLYHTVGKKRRQLRMKQERLARNS